MARDSVQALSIQVLGRRRAPPELFLPAHVCRTGDWPALFRAYEPLRPRAVSAGGGCVNWDRGTQRAGSGCPRARASSAPSTRAAPPSRSPRWSGTSPTKPPPHKVESVRRVLVLIHGPLIVGGGRYRGMGVFAAEAGE